MPLLLLLVLWLASLPIQWPGPFVGGPATSWLGAVGVVVGLLGLANFFARDTVRQLRRHPEERNAIGRRHGTRRLLFFFANLAGFALLILVGGYGATAREALTVDKRLLPGAEVLVLLPYFIVLVGSWALFYDAEKALHDSHGELNAEPFWSRGGYILFLARYHALLVLLPLALWIGQLGLARMFPGLEESTLGMVIASLATLGFVLFMPAFIPLILGLKPMPAGPLRTRLEKAAQRLGLRYRQLYVWHTRSNLATAMVAGLIPQLRNIVFTDLLLASLTEDEIEAVLGHEAGHVKHGHMYYYTGFIFLSFAALGAVYRLIELSAVASVVTADMLLLLSVLGTASYLFIVFGFLSRRCERQADVFGCRTMSCGDPNCFDHEPTTPLVPRGQALCPTGTRIFISALARVEEVNSHVRSSPDSSRGGLLNRLTGLLRFVGVVMATWQHSTIAKRIVFLHTIIEDPANERRFQRRVTFVRWGLLLGLIGTTIALSVWLGRYGE